MHVQSCCFAYKTYFLTFSLPSASLDLLSLHQSTHGEKRDARAKLLFGLLLMLLSPSPGVSKIGLRSKLKRCYCVVSSFSGNV